MTPVVRRKRHPYARLQSTILQLPDLVEIQRTHLRSSVDEGIQQTLTEISPIEDYTGSYAVEFGESRFEEPPVSVEECMSKDKTFAAPLFVQGSLYRQGDGRGQGAGRLYGRLPAHDALGDLHHQRDRAGRGDAARAFARALTSWSPRTQTKQVLTASLMPSRGSWLEFEVETKGYVSVRIDRKRKLPVTVLLKALGMGGPEEILSRFDDSWLMRNTLERDDIASQEEALLEVFRRQRPGEPVNIENAQNLVRRASSSTPSATTSRRSAATRSTRSSSSTCRCEFTRSPSRTSRVCSKRLIQTTEEVAEEEEFGRINYERIRHKLDEYEHFGNRRLRTVGELVQEAFRIGMYRMERVVRERMTTQDEESITPQTRGQHQAGCERDQGVLRLLAALAVHGPDEHALSGLSHRRRLSAMGAGGLSRERAPIEVRDVHPTHYGRMCPIETPEGPNIGLIGQLSTFATVDDYGFVQTPYRKVVDGKVTDEIEYLSADEEEEFTIAQANTPVDLETGQILEDEQILARRRGGDVATVAPDEVDYVDVAPVADGLRRHGAHPVPRARRRQPRAHGREHAAAGRAAAPQRGPVRRHRDGVPGRDRHRRRAARA